MQARVKRDGKIYTQIDENTGETIGLPIEMLVPGDVISIKIGDVYLPRYIPDR